MQRSKNKQHDIIDWNQRDNLQFDWQLNTKNILKTAQKFGVFFKKKSLTYQGLICLVKNSIILKYYCNSKYPFLNLFEYILKINCIVYVMAKMNLQQALHQSSWSHGPSEIIICWFDAVETFPRIINVETSCAVYYL